MLFTWFIWDLEYIYADMIYCQVLISSGVVHSWKMNIVISFTIQYWTKQLNKFIKYAPVKKRGHIGRSVDQVVCNSISFVLKVAKLGTVVPWESDFQIIWAKFGSNCLSFYKCCPLNIFWPLWFEGANILNLFDPCPNLDKKRRTNISFSPYGHAQVKDFLPLGSLNWQFCRLILGHHYYTLSLFDLCQVYRRRFLKK